MQLSYKKVDSRKKLENVDRTHLVLANGKSILQKTNGAKSKFIIGRGGGAVGRAVASDTRDPWFESRHRQEFYEHCQLNCIVKKKIKRKGGRERPVKKTYAQDSKSSLFLSFVQINLLT